MGTHSSASSDWTIDRWRELPEDGNRYEIIDGVLYVTPAPRPTHQYALSLLYDQLQPYATAIGLRILWSPAEITHGDRTVVQPDLFGFVLTRGMPLREWHEVQPLQLVIEALAPSTRLRDRTVKRGLYQTLRVPEYWIVDTDLNVIEVWRPDDEIAVAYAETMAWQPMATHAPLTIDVATLFRVVHGLTD